MGHVWYVRCVREWFVYFYVIIYFILINPKKIPSFLNAAQKFSNVITQLRAELCSILRAWATQKYSIDITKLEIEPRKKYINLEKSQGSSITSDINHDEAYFLIQF